LQILDELAAWYLRASLGTCGVLLATATGLLVAGLLFWGTSFVPMPPALRVGLFVWLVACAPLAVLLYPWGLPAEVLVAIAAAILTASVYIANSLIINFTLEFRREIDVARGPLLVWLEGLRQLLQHAFGAQNEAPHARVPGRL
jgi:hypothetical protein